MGRLVGIVGVLVVLGLAAAYLLTEPEVSNGLASGQSQVALSDAPEVIDPACFWPVLSATLSPDAPSAPTHISLQRCAPTAAEEETDGDWIRVSLQSGDPDDIDFERRFSGVRVAQVTDGGLLVLQAYDNWGGSGVFSSLVIGRLSDNGSKLQDVMVHPFGDRCTGGLAGTHMRPDGQLVASVNMTPWDILITPLSGLPSETLWDVGKARFGAAFGAAPSCAICCSAVTNEYVVSSSGGVRAVGLRYQPNDDPSPEDPLTHCLEQAVQKAAGEDGLVGPSERDTLNGLIDVCARNTSN